MSHRQFSLVVCAWALVAGEAIAQGPPPPPPPFQSPRDQRPMPAGTAVVRGRVVAAETGRPLRRARITVSGAELHGNTRTASTNPDGRYEIANLPPGRYTIRAVRSGYLGLQYGQRRPLELGTPLQLGDRQTIDRVDFSLPRASSLRGRVTDEAGEPIADVAVSAMRMMYAQGRRRLVPSGGASGRTDEEGEYRLSGLIPGSYFVVASARENWTVVVEGVEQRMAYAPTYYPGVSAAGDARRVTVAVGQATPSVDFALIPSRTAKVSGMASDAQGPLAGREILLTQSIGGATGGAQTLVGVVPTSPDGTFTFDHVQPGQYRLQARAFAAARGSAFAAQVAVLPIDVAGADLGDLLLVVVPGWSASGRIVAESGPLPARLRDRFRVASMPVDADLVLSPPLPPPPPGTGVVESGRLREDGTFTVTNLFGPARLRVDVPEGWAIKAILQDGRDVTDTPFELKSGEEVSGLEVVVSDRLTTVTGQLTDARGAALQDGTVLVFAEDPAKWFDESRWVRAVRPDQDGRYQIKGLPAGDYRAIALEYVEEGLWNDVEYLGSIRGQASKLTLAAGESRVLSLRLAR